jgi:hypothetical protein
MASQLEYHGGVNRTAQRPIPPLLAVFRILLLPLFLASIVLAQTNGRTSASSHSASAPVAAQHHSAPSSIAPRINPHPPAPPQHPGGGNTPPHSANGNTYYYPYLYAFPFPYVVDPNFSDAPASDENSEYQGGPTIFDRRGSGPDSYVPPSPAESSADLAATDLAEDDSAGGENASAPATEPPQPQTMLVFKDGHALEVDNYAIVSQTLYDLTPGHARKIALADLDLPATEKQNDDRGVTFQLPPIAQAN